MSNVTLVLGTSNLQVTTQALRLNSNLLVDHPDLQIYRVQTQACSQTFQEFVRALEDRTNLSFTPDNISDFCLLCDEFGACELRQACEAFAQPVRLDTALENREFQFEERGRVVASRVEVLERHVAVLTRTASELGVTIRELTVAIRDVQTVQAQTAAQSVASLESLRRDLDQLRNALQDQQGDVQRIETLSGVLSGQIAQVRNQTETITQSAFGLEALRPEVNQLKSDLEEVRQGSQMVVAWFPLNEAKSFDGILAHLRTRQGGDRKTVYQTRGDKGVRIVGGIPIFSAVSPGELFCWDFDKMRVAPTHYTMTAYGLKSWVVEGSLDGANWIEMDRQTDRQNFVEKNTATFAVSNPVESRFVRFVLAGHNDSDVRLRRPEQVELFGALFDNLNETLISWISAIDARLQMAKLRYRLPMTWVDMDHGIISFCRGKGLVTIASTFPCFDGSCQAFRAENDAGHWVSWDFGEMRIRPTHYQMRARFLKSWVVEGSPDGWIWTEVQRITHHVPGLPDLSGWWINSFTVWTETDSRFIRLTSTDQDHAGRPLEVSSVEFFGTLWE
jgi:hypothetical protein